MVRKIIQIGDKRLNETSKTVPGKEIVSRGIQDLIKDLIDTVNVDPEGIAGLSAVQLGDLKRVYIIRRIDLEDEETEVPTWELLINPEVRAIGNQTSTVWEGCMSVGEGSDRLFGPVERVDSVEVEYTNAEGVQKTLSAKGYLAHIIQHEQDHLDGILFLRHVKNPENIWKSGDIDEYIEKYGGYPPILES